MAKKGRKSKYIFLHFVKSSRKIKCHSTKYSRVQNVQAQVYLEPHILEDMEEKRSAAKDKLRIRVWELKWKCW